MTVEVPPLAPDVVPTQPIPEPKHPPGGPASPDIPPETGPDIPPEIEEPPVPGKHVPVQDPPLPGQRPTKLLHRVTH